MERTITITFTGDIRVEQSELTDLSTDVAQFMCQQLGFEAADIHVFGVRGRNGIKAFAAHVEP